MMTVVFAYHNIGRIGIEKLLEAGFEIGLVFTHEEDPDENIWYGSVAGLCEEFGIEHVTPQSPNKQEWIERIKAVKPEFIFSFYYRSMICSEILDIPAYGAYNLHGSLLPAYRGRCPVNWVIIKGESMTGVSLHEMVEKPDAGSVVAQEEVSIAYDDTAFTLFKKLEDATRTLLEEILPVMKTGVFSKTPQDLSRGSYFGGRKPEDGRIYWDRPAIEIYNLIRGVTKPYPGAFSYLKAEKVMFWLSAIDTETIHEPGLIALKKDTPLIGTEVGCIVPKEIEVHGKIFKDKDIKDFFKKHRGEQFI